MELGWAMRQRDRANQEQDVSETVPAEDDDTGEGIERDENSRNISEHHNDVRFSEGRAPVDLSKAKANRRREENTFEIPGLQPLVSSGCS